MKSDAFNYNNTSNGILLLEVTDEDTYRSLYNSSSSVNLLKNSSKTLSHSSSFLLNNKLYPEIRLCTVRVRGYLNLIFFNRSLYCI